MNQGFGNTQIESQELAQEQRLTAKQVAYMRLLEMPVQMLRARIEEELMNNFTLEATPGEGDGEPEREADSEALGDNDRAQGDEDNDFDDYAETQNQGTLDEIEYFDSESMGQGRGRQAVDDTAEWADSDTPQFHDTLMQQMGEYQLTDHQRELLEYLIGSLDDSGLLTKKLYVIADEMEIYRQVQTNTEELEEVLAILQQFDPPGIGARSLQETLLLQIDRRIEEKPDSTHWPMLRTVVAKQWKRIVENRWDRIREIMHISEAEERTLRRLLRTLTPSPGCPPGEMITGRRGTQGITADFIVEVEEDGTLRIQLNERGIPTLRINPEYERMATQPDERQQRALTEYVRGRVNMASAFMQNLNNRRATLIRVMREVAIAQRDYFVTGDDTHLHPLTMGEIAERAGTDNTIVSRVAGSKWVETPYGIRPLRWFFRTQGGVVTDKGETLDQDRIKRALAEQIEAEDKRHPLNDDALAKLMKSLGYPVARRTVAKYREALGIPVARLRQIR